MHQPEHTHGSSDSSITPRIDDGTLSAATSAAGPIMGDHSTMDVSDDPSPFVLAPGVLPIVERSSYQMLGEVGHGGIGKVLSAHDPRLGRVVAVKELLHGGRGAEARFFREALITARLQHPSIVPIYEAGRWPSGEPFYVMKLVSGRTLLDAIEASPLLENRLALLPQVIAVSEAIAYAHSQRIIHRDLKPANVIVGEFGETIIIDWGVAKDLAGDVDEDAPMGSSVLNQPSNLTFAGALLGTPAYMPPEQARGLVVDERADVYAIGAILYHVLGGRAPYLGATMDEVVASVIAAAPLPLEHRVRGLPLDLLAIVNKAMAREIDARYRTAAELAEDLRRFQTGQIVAAHRYSVRERLIRFTKRHRALLGVSTVALVVLVGIATLSVSRILSAQANAERKQFEAEASERRAITRADELTITQARASLEQDPTQTIALLKSLSPAWNGWGAVRTIAADAESRGIAKILRGHSALVEDVVFSPDGRWLASVGDDRRVILRDLHNGDVRVFEGHSDEVWRAAFSPDGKLLATAGRDKTIRLRDIETNKERIFEGHEASITSLVFSPDGKWIASRGYQEKVRVWNVEMGQGRVLSRTNESRKNLRGCVVFSPDGRTLAFADEGGVILENIATSERRLLAGIASGGIEMAFSPDGKRLVTGSEDGAVQVWDVDTGKSNDLYVHPGTRAPGVGFVGSGKFVVSHGTTGVVNLWDMGSAKPRRLGEHAGYVERMALSPDGSKVITSGADGAIQLGDVATGSAHLFRGFRSTVAAVAISSDGANIVGGGADGTVRFWKTPRDSSIANGGAVHWVAFAPDRTSVATLHEDGSVRKTTLASRSGDASSKTIVWQGPINHATPAPPGMSTEPPFVYSADGKLVAAAYGDGTIRIFFAAEEPRTLIAGNEEAFDIDFSKDGKMLAAGYQNGAVRLWDIASGQIKWTVEHHADVRAVAYSPNGSTIASGAMDGTLWLTNIVTGERKELEGHQDAILQLVFAPDGSKVLSASYDRTFRIWDVATGQSIGAQALNRVIRRILVYPDGSKFATLQADDTVRLWDMHTGDSRGILHGNTPELIEFGISSDGLHLVTAVQDSTARLWDIATREHRMFSLPHGSSAVVSFGPDEHSVVAASFDGLIKVWPDDLPSDATALRVWINAATPETVESLANP